MKGDAARDCKLSKSNKAQQGAALLALMAVLFVVITSVFLASLSLNKQRVAHGRHNAQVLSQAKQAILADALIQTPPGQLLCPDYDGDGVADYVGSNCRVARGFLPYRDLGLKDYRDAFGNTLWYVIDTRYANPSSVILNPSLGGNLLVDNSGAHVALVIAPGSIVANQQRSNTQNANAVAQYLEGENADGNTSRFVTLKDDVHNDQLLALSEQEFWPVLEKRVVSTLAENLQNYYDSAGCGQLPWAAVSASPGNSQANSEWGYMPLGTALAHGGAAGCPSSIGAPSWIAGHWSDVLRYAFCGPSGANCLTVSGDKNASIDAILISSGPLTGSQSRPSSDVSNYLESENADLDMQFEYRETRNYNDAFNDVLYPFTP